MILVHLYCKTKPMKKQFSILAVLGIVFFALTISCKKDQVVGYKFTYELKDYSLKSGHQVLIGSTNHTPKNTYEFDLMLVGSGITFDNSSNDFTGKGDFISLKMYSIDPESIASGQYTFDIFSSKDSLTFIDGAVGINYDIVSNTDTTIYYIKNGVMDVEKNGNTYSLDFDLYTQENNQVKGFFKGLLEIHTPPTKK
jgi:hypothetical protein